MKQMMLSVALMITMLSATSTTHACTTCGCTIGMLGKNSKVDDQNTKWYAKYIYDQIVWRDKPAAEIHTLHHQDHDVHNKTVEVTHHYQIGRHVTDDLNIFVDVPYAVKSSIEIEEHHYLGAGQRAQGLGDLQLLSEYRLWHNDHNAVGIAGGFKFPTGSTREKNFQEDRFETEFQPGSGAYNYIIGGFYKWQADSFTVTANSSYVLTTKGAQSFQYGDLYTASLEAGYTINPGSKHFKTQLGMNSIFQLEGKEETEGVKNPDSGGKTVLLGPAVKVDANQNLSFSGTFLYPVSQRLNGLTQKQAFNWILATQVKF